MIWGQFPECSAPAVQRSLYISLLELSLFLQQQALVVFSDQQHPAVNGFLPLGGFCSGILPIRHLPVNSLSSSHWVLVSCKFHQCSTMVTCLPFRAPHPCCPFQQCLDLSYGRLFLGHAISALGGVAVPYICHSYIF